MTFFAVPQSGQALDAGKGFFLFGPPGNGKTTIAEHVSQVFGRSIWIPRALWIDGQLVRMFDPCNHVETPYAGTQQATDRRWVHIRRPAIVVGGELVLESLDFVVDPKAGICEAPLLGTVGGTLVAVAGCYWASERVHAQAKNRRQLATINRLITLALGGNAGMFNKEFLPDERLAAVNAIGLMGPRAEKAVPVLLDVLKLSALDMTKHQAVFLASVDALVKVGVVDDDVVSTLKAISEGICVKPADKVETARIAADSALRRLEHLEPAFCA